MTLRPYNRMADLKTSLDFLLLQLEWLPNWATSLIVLLPTPVLAHLVHRFLFRLATTWDRPVRYSGTAASAGACAAAAALCGNSPDPR